MTTACFGDSIAVLLSSALQAEDHAVWGAPISDLPGQVRDHRPDVAVLSAGANDVLRGLIPVDFRPLLNVQQKLRERGAQVVTLPVQFAPWHPAWGHPATLAVNAVTKPIPARLPWWGWQRDGVHPNRFGRSWLARQVRAYSD